VGPRTDLDDVKRRKILPIPRLDLWLLGHPACSQLLYWLHNPGSPFIIYTAFYKSFDYCFWRDPLPRSWSIGPAVLTLGFYIVPVVSERGPLPKASQNTVLSNDS
jgi:hypothetical protein